MKINEQVRSLLVVAGIVLVLSGGIFYLATRQPSLTTHSTASLPLDAGTAAQSVEALPAAGNLLVGSGSFSVGPEEAKATVVEFFDPECETCAEVSPYIKNEIKHYNAKVRWVFRYMAYHPSSAIAIQILEAARKQNLYFEAMALLFERQSEWGAKHDGSVQKPQEEALLKIISSLPGINLKKLKDDMKDPAIARLIENDKKEGTQAGVVGTPTLFVNGRIIKPLSLDTMIERIEAALK